MSGLVKQTPVSDVKRRDRTHVEGALAHGRPDSSLNRVAFSATWHCLTGCAIGEVLGVAIGTALGWGNAPTIVLAIVLAFFFGYAFTAVPLLRSGLALGAAADTRSRTSTTSVPAGLDPLERNQTAKIPKGGRFAAAGAASPDALEPT